MKSVVDAARRDLYGWQMAVLRAALSMSVSADGVARLCVEEAAAPAGGAATFGAELVRALREVAGDTRARAAILVAGEARGAADGVDVEALTALGTCAAAEALCREAQALCAEIEASGKPIVAVVRGPVRGPRFGLALACHARVLSSDAEVGLSEVALGLLPAAGSLQRLARLAGLEAALDVGVSGARVGAARARQLGLANDVVSAHRVEQAAADLARALAGGARPRGAQPFFRGLLSLESTRVGRALLFRDAREEVAARTHGHCPAEERVIDVLEALASRGLPASREVEAKAFGELALSTTARRLMELSLARAGFDEAGADLSMRRLRAAFTDEAARLVREGAPRVAIERALVSWGWPAGLRSLIGNGALDTALEALRGEAAGTPAGRKIMPEEVQMRCALRLVNEALHCLGEGAVKSAREGDVGAVVGLGFPAFRGGPFRYVDSLGAAEALKRVGRFHSLHGARWAPAPLLVEMARGGRRFY